MLEEEPDENMPPADVMRKSFELLESGEIEISMRRQPALAFSLSISGELFQTLLELNWSICDAPSGADFLTGDSPVTSIALFDDGMVQFGANFVHPNFEVSFPISPSVCLYLTKRQRQLRYRCGRKFCSRNE